MTHNRMGAEQGQEAAYWSQEELEKRATDLYAAVLDRRVAKRILDNAWSWPGSPEGADQEAIVRCVAAALSVKGGCVLLGRHAIILWADGTVRLYTGSKTDRSRAGFLYTGRVRQTEGFLDLEDTGLDFCVRAAKAFVEVWVNDLDFFPNTVAAEHGKIEPDRDC